MTRLARCSAAVLGLSLAFAAAAGAQPTGGTVLGSFARGDSWAVGFDGTSIYWIDLDEALTLHKLDTSGVPQVVEHPAPSAAAVLLIEPFPEQLGELAARDRLLLQRQVAQQGERLARLEALHRRPRALHLHGAQDPDPHDRHNSPPCVGQEAGPGRRLPKDVRRICECLWKILQEAIFHYKGLEAVGHRLGLERGLTPSSDTYDHFGGLG